MIRGASLLFASFAFIASLTAVAEDDAYRWRHSRELHAQLEVLRQTIDATQALLETEQGLYYLVDRYQRLHKKLDENPNDLRYFAPVLQAAVEVWQEIKRQDLAHLFDENFLEGLTFYVKIAERQGLIKSPNNEGHSLP